MTKFFTNFGKELDDNAAICLNCGVVVGNTTQNNTSNNSVNNEKKKGMPTWAIVLIIVGCVILIPVILLIVLAVFAYNVVSDTTIDSELDFNFDDYVDENVLQKGTIGDTLMTSNFKITLNDALIYSSIGDDSYYVDTPKEGKEYLVFFIDVENISGESQYISDFDFDGYVDGYTVSVSSIYNDIDGVEEIGTTLSAGKKTRGFVAFEVDTDWKEFELHYSDFLEDEELVFTVVNEEDSSTDGV